MQKKVNREPFLLFLQAQAQEKVIEINLVIILMNVEM